MHLHWFLSTILIGGFVLFCYIYFLSKCSIKRVWAGISNPSVQSFYLASIFLSAIFYLIVWIYYLYQPLSIMLYLGNYLFLFGALLWPVFLYYLSFHLTSLSLALTLTSLGALLLLIGTCFSSVFHIGIFLCSLYLFLHVFCLDNVYWLLSYQQSILRMN